MTALTRRPITLRHTRTSLPGPIRRLLHDSELAEPPDAVSAFRVSRAARRDVEKTLLQLSADKRNINLFMLLSPALSRATPTVYEGGGERVLAMSGLPRATGPPQAQSSTEPESPWWRPDRIASGRRYAFSTESFDFVEVIVGDDREDVFIRTIR